MGLIGNSSIVQKLEREKEKLKEKKNDFNGFGT